MTAPRTSLLITAIVFGLGLAGLWAATFDETGEFKFRFPHSASYQIETPAPAIAAGGEKPQWLPAQAMGSTNRAEFGSRVVLQLQTPNDLPKLIAGHDLQLVRQITKDVFILQAPDAWSAALEAARLAALPEVKASYPVVRLEAALDGQYAPKPNDQYFFYQWYFENRSTNGSPLGPDINLRGAWPFTRGAGITQAVADTGFELNHPELTNAADGAPHFSFLNLTTNGNPPNSSAIHGTAVAGFLGAQANNSIGVVGASPDAKLASWVIITNGLLVGDDRLMDMFQYQSNTVQVQNHSWGTATSPQFPRTLLTDIGISNAITFGRGGRGVIMTRSGGNNRGFAGNANDNGYCADPRVIPVASVRVGGRAASYSSPGACLLVAAGGGDAQDGVYQFTTDRQGFGGYNIFQTLDDPNFYNYAYNFYGTSAAAPQIAGIAALMLSVNPELNYRDVQQILLLAARHFDFADPDLQTNGAGFVVSHNDGFGVPDAGVAVQLARGWSNRPAAAQLIFTHSEPMVIPDDGLRVQVAGIGVPPQLASLHCLPSLGPHADNPTQLLPLVDFGYGTNTSGFDLTNKGALIQRGTGTLFAAQISNAAAAGAAFAVVYNYLTNTTGSGAPGGDQLIPMGVTDFVPLPAVFIGHSDGEALQALFATNVSAQAQIRLNSTNQVFSITNTLLCEHVGLRVMTDHQLRGDVRITLMSPSGTRSVLETYGTDTNAGPTDWTYYTTHHFFESSFGDWTASISDEGGEPGATGSVQQVSLILNGVPISDSDHDGLDDNWEQAQLGTLAQGPKDDPENDGYSNMREFLMGTNPNVVDVPFALDLSPWNSRYARLSWPGRPGFSYTIFGGTDVASLGILTNIPARFPETEWFTDRATITYQFFRVQAVPPP